jgi:hypothetical protein
MKIKKLLEIISLFLIFFHITKYFLQNIFINLLIKIYILKFHKFIHSINNNKSD